MHGAQRREDLDDRTLGAPPIRTVTGGNMQRRSTTGTIVGVAGAILAVVFVVGLIAGANAGCGLGSFIGSFPVVWIVGIGAALVIGTLAWFLLDAGESPTGSPRAEERRCPGCNRAILRQWRMCPYCGTMLDREDPVAESAPDPASIN